MKFPKTKYHNQKINKIYPISKVEFTININYKFGKKLNGVD